MCERQIKFGIKKKIQFESVCEFKIGSGKKLLIQKGNVEGNIKLKFKVTLNKILLKVIQYKVPKE